MRLELSPDQAAWQSTAASFAQEHVAPAAAFIDESGEFPSALVAEAGARGYLLKEAVQEELLDTIRAVHAGRKMLSPTISQGIAEHATDDALTNSEIDVLRLIAEGKANKQIADQLSIAEETVKSRVKNILSKLGADDRTHAAMIGLKRGIIGLQG